MFFDLILNKDQNVKNLAHMGKFVYIVNFSISFEISCHTTCASSTACISIFSAFLFAGSCYHLA